MEQDLGNSRRIAEESADPTSQQQHEDNTIYPHFKGDENGIGSIDVNQENETGPESDGLTRQSTPTTVLARTLFFICMRESGRDPGPPPDGGFKAWSQVALAHLVMCNTWGYINSFGVFQTYYTETLHRPPSDISWIGSVQTFLLFFIGTFSGRATDAGLFKLTWVIGATAEVVSIFLTSLCTQYWQLFLTQGVLQGIGCGLMFCPTMSLVPTYFTKRRALAMGIVATGSATGGLVLPGIVNALLPRVGFAWTMRTLGFITLGSLLPSLLFLQQRLPPRKSGPIVEWVAFKEAPYSLFAIGMFFVFLGLYIGFFYIGSYATNTLHASESTSINLVMVMNAVGIVSRIIPCFCVDMWTGPMNLLVPFSLLSAIIAYAWAGVDSVGGLYAFSVVYGAVTAAVQGIFSVTLTTLTADLKKTGVRYGMVLSILSIDVLTGNPIAGALIQIDDGEYLYMQMFMGSSMLVGTLALAGARIAKSGVAWVRT
ncbi:hypothetical protein PENARI_c013G00974 [Penicillium arizonense]|uniref:Major facilitator superfamily (MFS) profile domain-containing protein n=1 Tax=Penicillium arizonense TaxID=1835702 RepID=A0A1F5L0E7_PENAI|nr:hypothetical protein PENARI_c150G10526 [Penicillium arizonense]XP_022482133.1 hypothetical protein PENARI_c146G08378 [Penicillium arizonense]XP_022487027.1 hypothetical protein PENARI_c013G00974 [Penicillium arizonense]OGE46654.1 hypothetical protein PENARI_c150G10526 [Penicillium arizonense]OGE46665.1 hypothetical protein PENARI_c146G08378 [Penicillium arizonense]OGE51583.1 hypothetical protein PENARI_c013G00974 [Penicillium arizonense]